MKNNENQLDLFSGDLFGENDIKKEYEELVKTLNYHCDRYYNDDEPEISDFEYDMMNQRLKKIEADHPEKSRLEG